MADNAAMIILQRRRISINGEEILADKIGFVAPVLYLEPIPRFGKFFDHDSAFDPSNAP